MRGYWPILFLAAAIIGCGTKGAGSLPGGRKDARSSPPVSRVSSVRVKVVHPKTENIKRTTTQPGSINSFEAVDLYAKVSGYLENQTADIGDGVQKGQVIANIDAPELVAAVQAAEATLQKARAEVTQRQASLVARNDELSAAVAKRDQAGANLKSLQAVTKLRKLQYDRIKALADLHSIQQELVDEKAQEREAAIAKELAGEKAIVTAAAEVRAAEATLNEARAMLADAQAEVEISQALLAKARQFVDYTSIIAPFSGIITERNYFNGDFIRAAISGGNVPQISAPLFRVARTDKMRVLVQVPDRDAPYVAIGDPATIAVDSLPGRTFTGKVSRFAHAQKYHTRNMRTEIDIENRDGQLQDGMYGSVTIVLDTGETGVTLPSSCLFGAADNGERSVRVVKDGKAQIRRVKVGIDLGVNAQIVAGLTPDDRVIVEHGTGLAAGTEVEVVPSENKLPKSERTARRH